MWLLLYPHVSTHSKCSFNIWIYRCHYSKKKHQYVAVNLIKDLDDKKIKKNISWITKHCHSFFCAVLPGWAPRHWPQPAWCAWELFCLFCCLSLHFLPTPRSQLRGKKTLCGNPSNMQCVFWYNTTVRKIRPNAPVRKLIVRCYTVICELNV